MSIGENIKHVVELKNQAAEKSGRSGDDVLLVAVTKLHTVEEINEAIDCGITDIGENKVQEIMDKYEPMGNGVKWHLIGHLQTNKVKYIIDKVVLIHSVESFKLAEEISKRAVQKGVTANVLVEVNIADEESKFGVKPDECEQFIKDISILPNIIVKGLMTVAPAVENPEENRKYFRQMKQLLVDINSKKIDNVSMDVLSMGMTGDYEVAIEEGATIVRVGTGIFGARFYPNKNS